MVNCKAAPTVPNILSKMLRVHSQSLNCIIIHRSRPFTIYYFFIAYLDFELSASKDDMLWDGGAISRSQEVSFPLGIDSLFIH